MYLLFQNLLFTCVRASSLDGNTFTALFSPSTFSNKIYNRRIGNDLVRDRLAWKSIFKKTVQCMPACNTDVKPNMMMMMMMMMMLMLMMMMMMLMLMVMVMMMMMMVMKMMVKMMMMVMLDNCEKIGTFVSSNNIKYSK